MRKNVKKNENGVKRYEITIETNVSILIIVEDILKRIERILFIFPYNNI